MQLLASCKALAKEHDQQSSIIKLENILSSCASKKPRGLGATALELDGPAKRCRVMWKEARSPDADKQQ